MRITFLFIKGICSEDVHVGSLTNEITDPRYQICPKYEDSLLIFSCDHPKHINQSQNINWYFPEHQINTMKEWSEFGCGILWFFFNKGIKSWVS